MTGIGAELLPPNKKGLPGIEWRLSSRSKLKQIFPRRVIDSRVDDSACIKVGPEQPPMLHGQVSDGSCPNRAKIEHFIASWGHGLNSKSLVSRRDPARVTTGARARAFHLASIVGGRCRRRLGGRGRSRRYPGRPTAELTLDDVSQVLDDQSALCFIGPIWRACRSSVRPSPPPQSMRPIP